MNFKISIKDSTFRRIWRFLTGKCIFCNKKVGMFSHIRYCSMECYVYSGDLPKLKAPIKSLFFGRTSDYKNSWKYQDRLENKL